MNWYKPYGDDMYLALERSAAQPSAARRRGAERRVAVASDVWDPGAAVRCCPTQPHVEPAMLGEPINTSARARGNPSESDSNREQSSGADSRHEARRVPTTNSVAGSVVVREWSLRDV